MSFHIIIPARFHSSRLPGKVLADLGGKTMLQHVFEKAEQSGADSIVVATDSDKIAAEAESFGATVCMTLDSHTTGTERIAECVSLLDYEKEDVIVGLQADEPFISPNIIRQLGEELVEHTNVKVASVCQLIENPEELYDPNVVKVVMNRRKNAMYFSRAPIPWDHEQFSMDAKPKVLNGKYYRHIGIYAYHAGYLEQYVDSDGCEAESLEKLEQLRVLWDCGRIHMTVTTESIPVGIDTEQDLDRARALF